MHDILIIDSTEWMSLRILEVRWYWIGAEVRCGTSTTYSVIHGCLSLSWQIVVTVTTSDPQDSWPTTAWHLVNSVCRSNYNILMGTEVF
jgi:hypothetical protein